MHKLGRYAARSGAIPLLVVYRICHGTPRFLSRPQDIPFPPVDVQFSSTMRQHFQNGHGLSTVPAPPHFHTAANAQKWPVTGTVFYIPMTMIEKLAMNMAMEVKAARSRMKSVIGRLPFPLCSYNVLFMFMRQAATANLRYTRIGDGKHFPSAALGKTAGIWTPTGWPISLRSKRKSGND